jgi:hypothetical protein
MHQKHIKINLLLFTSILFSGCAANKPNGFIQTQNGSSYNYKIIKTSNEALPVICGSVYEYGTKYLLIAAAVQVDGKKDSQTDSGKFVLHVQPGKHKFKAMWFAYLRCETRAFNTSPGDTIIKKRKSN